MHEIFKEFNTEEVNLKETLEAIKQVKPGDNYMDSDHTLKHFKKGLVSEIMEQTFDLKTMQPLGSIWEKANKKYKEILSRKDLYRLPEDKSKEIDKIVETAYKDIVG